MSEQPVTYGVQIKSWDDVNNQIIEIRDKQQVILKLQHQYDDAATKAHKKYIEPKESLTDEVKYITGKIKDFCDAHRDDMTESRKKSLPSGEVYYREKPMSLLLKEGVNEKTVVQKIVKLGKQWAEKYLKIKTDISKTSIKKDYDENRIDDKFLGKLGLITSKEEGFYVMPNPPKQNAKS